MYCIQINIYYSKNILQIIYECIEVMLEKSMESVLKKADNLLKNLFNCYFEEDEEICEVKLARAVENMYEDITAKRQKNKTYKPPWTITEVNKNY